MATFTPLWTRRMGRYNHHNHLRLSSPPKHRPYLLPTVAVLCIFVLVLRAVLFSSPSTHRHNIPADDLRTHASSSAYTQTAAKRCKLNTASADAKYAPPTRVFVHLHKCGGNNVKVALEGFAHRNHLRHWHTCHASTADSWLEHLYFARRIKSSNGTDCNLKPFVSLPRLKRRSYDLIFGHQHVGIHEAISPRATEYFTMLRHPLMRKVSHYSHFESPKHNNTGNGGDMHINDYLLYRTRNYMTKRLSTKTVTSEIGTDFRGRLIDNNRHAARSALKAAIDNLNRRFFFVGLHERYAESVCILSSLLNSACYSRAPNGITTPLKARSIYRKFINTNTHRTGETTNHIVKTLPASVVRGTLVAEKLDLILYEYATRKFEKQLKQHAECTLENLRQRDRRRGS